MADGSNSRYRRSDDYGRNDAGQGDPLAELARLIGQNDPYSDFARSETGRPSSPDWAAPQPPPARAPYQTPSYQAPAHPEPAWSQPRYAEPSAHDRQDAYADSRYADDRYGDNRYADYGHSGRYEDSYQGHAPADPYGYADDRYGGAQDPQQGYADDPYYGAGQPAQEYYEERRPPRRGGLVTVIAVLALAVLGTAGAYAYRTVFGKSGAPLAPPVIKAEPGPTKVVPAGQGDTQSVKAIRDRVGDNPQNERIVSREEQPVDMRNAPMRNVLPGAPNAAAPAATNSAPSAAVPFQPPAGQSGSAFNVPPAQQTAPAQVSTEPKKIRTVPIRPDRTDTARAPAPEPARPRAAPAPAAPAESAAPLSLSPAASRSVASARTAAVAPQAETPQPEGSYSVQVTSQRSEADAQSAWRSLQTRYPAVLGNRQAAIRRADLGSRGVYYRAMVGPFANSGDASEMCSALKNAGGDCVIQRN
ncbi:MAG: SPOR domain-containing protein [Pseudorhodoplanes sp.]